MHDPLSNEKLDYVLAFRLFIDFSLVAIFGVATNQKTYEELLRRPKI